MYLIKVNIGKIKNFYIAQKENLVKIIQLVLNSLILMCIQSGEWMFHYSADDYWEIDFTEKGSSDSTNDIDCY